MHDRIFIKFFLIPSAIPFKMHFGCARVCHRVYRSHQTGQACDPYVCTTDNIPPPYGLCSVYENSPPQAVNRNDHFFDILLLQIQVCRHLWRLHQSLPFCTENSAPGSAFPDSLDIPQPAAPFGFRFLFYSNLHFPLLFFLIVLP